MIVLVVWLIYNIHTQALIESVLPDPGDYLQSLSWHIKRQGFTLILWSHSESALAYKFTVITKSVVPLFHSRDVYEHVIQGVWLCRRGGVPLTYLPVEVFERSRVRPLPASIEVQIIQTHPQSGAVSSEETCRNITHMYKTQCIFTYLVTIRYEFLCKFYLVFSYDIFPNEQEPFEEIQF